MFKLNLPLYDIKIKNINSEIYVFDIIRKKNIILTPEEWVRQNIIHHLVNDHKYSTIT